MFVHSRLDFLLQTAKSKASSAEQRQLLMEIHREVLKLQAEVEKEKAKSEEFFYG